MPRDINLVDIQNQFGPGFSMNLPRIREESQWDEWYSNDFASLWPLIPTEENGYILFTKRIW